MLIIEINIRQIFCVPSIRIAQCYVRQFNILRYKRHVLWENVPDHKVGVTYSLYEDLQAYPHFFFRMSSATFDKLLVLFGPSLTFQDNKLLKSVSPE